MRVVETAVPAMSTTTANPTSAMEPEDDTTNRLSSEVPGVLDLFKMAYYPKVLEDISPTHKFLTLQGWAYCLAGAIFMVSPWAASMLLTFGQLATDSCPAETRNITLLEPGEEVCGPKWGGSIVSDDLLEDKTEGASCMCPNEKYALQLAACLVSMVGYYYVQMARGNSLHFIATTTFNRLVLVPVRPRAKTALRAAKFPQNPPTSSSFAAAVSRPSVPRNQPCGCPPGTCPCLLFSYFWCSLTRVQVGFFIAYFLGARGAICLLFGLLDPFLTLLTVLSLNGSRVRFYHIKPMILP